MSLTQATRNVIDGLPFLHDIVELHLGQSNMRSVSEAVGGDMRTLLNVHYWNGGQGTDQPGTTWTTPVVGQYPITRRVNTSSPYAQVLSYAISRETAILTGQPVWTMLYAFGGQSGRSFVTPEGRIANGWVLPEGQTDISALMYPGIVNGLAALPFDKSHVDVIHIHQGENDKEDFGLWRQYWAVVLDELASAGVYRPTETKVIFGQIAIAPTNNEFLFAQESNLSQLASGRNDELLFVKSEGIPRVDGLHFSGVGVVKMAKRMVGAHLGIQEPVVDAMGFANRIIYDCDAPEVVSGTWLYNTAASPASVNGPDGVTTGHLIYSRRLYGAGDVQMMVAESPIGLRGNIYTRGRAAGGWSAWKSVQIVGNDVIVSNLPIQVGANGTGPGGTGRALFIANA